MIVEKRGGHMASGIDIPEITKDGVFNFLKVKD